MSGLCKMIFMLRGSVFEESVITQIEYAFAAIKYRPILMRLK